MICLHVSLLLSYELLSVCPIPYIEYGTFKKKKRIRYIILAQNCLLRFGRKRTFE